MKLEGELTLRAFLDYAEAVEESERPEWSPVQPSEEDSVKVMTIHQAKGLEFDTVFVPGMAKDVLPNNRLQHNPAEKGKSLDFAMFAAGMGLKVATLERAHVLAYRRRADEAAWVASHLEVPGRPEPGAYLPDPEEFPIMRTAVDGQLLRVFIDDADTFGGQPLYRAVVEKARELGLSNAVVLRAPKGFGTHRRLHSDAHPDYVTELPVLVEVVGTAQEIGRLLPFLDEAVPEGLLTIEGVKMLLPQDRPGA